MLQLHQRFVGPVKVIGQVGYLLAQLVEGVA